MKSTIYRLSILSFALSALTLNIAFAGDVTTSESSSANVAVPVNDLNLAKPAGLASLHHRVESAARRVCGVENFRVSLDVERKNRDCVSATIDSAMGKIQSSGLTAINQTAKTSTKTS